MQEETRKPSVRRMKKTRFVNVVEKTKTDKFNQILEDYDRVNYSFSESACKLTGYRVLLL